MKTEVIRGGNHGDPDDPTMADTATLAVKVGCQEFPAMVKLELGRMVSGKVKSGWYDSNSAEMVEETEPIGVLILEARHMRELGKNLIAAADTADGLIAGPGERVQ